MTSTTRRAPNTASIDGGLAAATAILVAVGIVTIYSVTAALDVEHAVPPLFLRHLGALGVALVAALALSRVPLPLWRRLALPFWCVSILLLAATLFLAPEVKGAQRWLPLPGLDLRFQPGELVKWTTLLAVAAVLSRREGRAAVSRRQFFLALGLGLLPAGLFYQQPDLGSAAVVFGLVGLQLFVSGAPLRTLVAPALAGAACIAAYIALVPYARDRLLGFLQTWERAQDEGFQLVQSFVAFGRGGLTGVGIGDGRQKLFYLPEAHNDFILAVVAEEMGLIGVLAVLGAFAALLLVGTRIALAARDRFSLLLAAGMTSLLTLPALLNGAVVMGLLPTKGLALPFLSYGRTALVMSFLALGLLLAVARQGVGRRRRPRGRSELRGMFAR